MIDLRFMVHSSLISATQSSNGPGCSDNDSQAEQPDGDGEFVKGHGYTLMSVRIV